LQFLNHVLHMSAATDLDEEEWYEKLKALKFVS
jgi:hypothetical protein